MILRQDGLDFIEILDQDDEQLFVANNPGFIYVTDLPYSISGYYLYDSVSDTYVTNLDKDLEVLKQQRMEEISTKFNDMMEQGTLTSSLGFTVDNRRGNGKDDKDNVASLIELNQTDNYFSDVDNNFHLLTIADLQTLKQEMIMDGLGKYQWKWNKQNEVMTSTTIDGCLAIDI